MHSKKLPDEGPDWGPVVEISIVSIRETRFAEEILQSYTKHEVR